MTSHGAAVNTWVLSCVESRSNDGDSHKKTTIVIIVGLMILLAVAMMLIAVMAILALVRRRTSGQLRVTVT